MIEEPLIGTRVDRRSFLRGSALFAAALGIGVASSAFAQEPQQPQPPPPQPAPEDEKQDPPPQDGETKVDKDGREYRVCPQCSANMYRQGRTWTCENCGYSYVE